VWLCSMEGSYCLQVDTGDRGANCYLNILRFKGDAVYWEMKESIDDGKRVNSVTRFGKAEVGRTFSKSCFLSSAWHMLGALQ